MNESTTDCVTLKITRAGKRWRIEAISVHGHSRQVLVKWGATFAAPPRALLDPEVCGSAGRGVLHALERMDPILPL